MIRFTSAAALALALLFSATTASAQGKLVFATERHDIAPIAEGDDATVTFAFVNEGDAPFSLVEVRASCGCTTPSYTMGPVAPGASGEIVVTYHSEGRPGPFQSTVFVATDASEPRSVTLRLSGDVVPTFTINGARQGNLVFDRDVWALDSLRSGEALQQSFRFQNQGDAPIRVREARASVEGVEIIFPDRPLFTGDTAGILIMIDDPERLAGQSGHLDIGITLDTTDEQQPTKSLRIRGRILTGG